MMATDDDTLIPLHNRWLAQLTEMIERDGTDSDAASESMLTIAVTGLMRLHGPRHVAARLAVVAGMLTKAANDAAVEGRSDDKTRH